MQHTGAQSVEETSYPNPKGIAEGRSGSDADIGKISLLLWAQHWELAAVVQFVPEVGTCQWPQRQGVLPACEGRVGPVVAPFVSTLTLTLNF